ncbi:MAG: helix-turn-helix domain-containing protein [Gemmatales bacterium]|nr:AraC family transcriptional regulator [Gemmatales bacterium]MCS7160239.1 AraC family transcriptional regulator [Gemmatales bacterium]MDW8175439.1 helix-turn-helix domain-containing protein [Gemmatales bacterium]MDW8221987.1 helix-turn-helix domain-containing protein [Gemmatales bacterium]
MNQSTAPTDRARILRVLLHIESCLEDSLPLDALADQTALSPFHFHRLFRSVVGEPVHRHIRRLRLERAALFLKNSTVSTVDLSLTAGFDSREAFSRAFKTHFGAPPRVFRERATQGLKQLLRKLDGQPPLVVRIEEWPSQPIVLTRVIGSPFRVTEAWWHFLHWAKRRGLIRRNSRIAQIHHDDEIVTPWEKHRTDLCLLVPEPLAVQPPYVASFLPAGWHAVAEFQGSAYGLYLAWLDLTERWLPVSGWHPAHHGFYDLADADVIPLSLTAAAAPLSNGIRCQLCIPVQRRPYPGWPILVSRELE